jgi:hypothetical protein
MRARFTILACAPLALGACNSLLGFHDFETGGAIDAPLGQADATGDAAPCIASLFPYKISNVDPCDAPVPVASLSLAYATIDTETGVVTDGNGPIAVTTKIMLEETDKPVRVITAMGLTVAPGTRTTVTGAYPLVFIVTGSVDIAGNLELSAQGGTPGAGARKAAECGDLAGKQGTGQQVGASGCGGGGLGTVGGRGGQTPTFVGGTGGAVDPSDTLVPLRGGCPGGAVMGGNNNGAGGGAIQISAAFDVDVPGVLTVSGGGGASFTSPWLGLGGGAGGGILLEAGRKIKITGDVTANGGGGGGGTGSGLFGVGQDGSKTSATPALGGTCSGCQKGGSGAAGSTAAGNGADSPDDSHYGGGGGGGAGLIWLRSTTVDTSTGVVSPVPHLDSAPQ